MFIKRANFKITEVNPTVESVGLLISKTASKLSEVMTDAEYLKILGAKTEDDLYFLTRAMTCDVANENGDLFPYEEIKKSYKTFINKGLFLNHDADDASKAVGKIAGAWLIDENIKDRYVICLCRVSRKCEPKLAMKIEAGILGEVSMGCSCEECECQICHTKAKSANDFCDHLKQLGHTITSETGERIKCVSINHGLTFNELSIVSSPADSSARMISVYANEESKGIEKKAENSEINIDLEDQQQRQSWQEKEDARVADLIIKDNSKFYLQPDFLKPFETDSWTKEQKQQLSNLSNEEQIEFLAQILKTSGFENADMQEVDEQSKQQFYKKLEELNYKNLYMASKEDGYIFKSATIKRADKKGAYTGKIVNAPDGEFMIGKIVGNTGDGKAVYATHEFDPLNKFLGKQIGELNEDFIKKYLNNKQADSNNKKTSSFPEDLEGALKDMTIEEFIIALAKSDFYDMQDNIDTEDETSIQLMKEKAESVKEDDIKKTYEKAMTDEDKAEFGTYEQFKKDYENGVDSLFKITTMAKKTNNIKGNNTESNKTNTTLPNAKVEKRIGKWTIESYDNRKGGKSYAVSDGNNVDYIMVGVNGTVLYDAPEKLPENIKNEVQKFIDSDKSAGKTSAKEEENKTSAKKPKENLYEKYKDQQDSYWEALGEFEENALSDNMSKEDIESELTALAEEFNLDKAFLIQFFYDEHPEFKSKKATKQNNWVRKTSAKEEESKTDMKNEKENKGEVIKEEKKPSQPVIDLIKGYLEKSGLSGTELEKELQDKFKVHYNLEVSVKDYIEGLDELKNAIAEKKDTKDILEDLAVDTEILEVQYKEEVGNKKKAKMFDWVESVANIGGEILGSSPEIGLVELKNKVIEQKPELGDIDNKELLNVLWQVKDEFNRENPEYTNDDLKPLTEYLDTEKKASRMSDAQKEAIELVNKIETDENVSAGDEIIEKIIKKYNLTADEAFVLQTKLEEKFPNISFEYSQTQWDTDADIADNEENKRFRQKKEEVVEEKKEETEEKVEKEESCKKKAETEDYSDILEDVVDNFEKITGVAIEKLFNPKSEDDHEMPLFDQEIVDSTMPALEEYLKNKYDFDIYANEDFLYDLDDRLSAFNPNYKDAKAKNGFAKKKAETEEHKTPESTLKDIKEDFKKLQDMVAKGEDASVMIKDLEEDVVILKEQTENKKTKSDKTACKTRKNLIKRMAGEDLSYEQAMQLDVNEPKLISWLAKAFGVLETTVSEIASVSGNAEDLYADLSDMADSKGYGWDQIAKDEDEEDGGYWLNLKSLVRVIETANRDESMFKDALNALHNEFIERLTNYYADEDAMQLFVNIVNKSNILGWTKQNWESEYKKLAEEFDKNHFSINDIEFDKRELVRLSSSRKVMKFTAEEVKDTTKESSTKKMAGGGAGVEFIFDNKLVEMDLLYIDSLDSLKSYIGKKGKVGSGTLQSYADAKKVKNMGVVEIIEITDSSDLEQVEIKEIINKGLYAPDGVEIQNFMYGAGYIRATIQDKIDDDTEEGTLYFWRNAERTDATGVKYEATVEATVYVKIAFYPSDECKDAYNNLDSYDEEESELDTESSKKTADNTIRRNDTVEYEGVRNIVMDIIGDEAVIEQEDFPYEEKTVKIDSLIKLASKQEKKSAITTPPKPDNASLTQGMKWVFNSTTNAWEQKPTTDTNTVEVSTTASGEKFAPTYSVSVTDVINDDAVLECIEDIHSLDVAFRKASELKEKYKNKDNFAINIFGYQTEEALKSTVCDYAKAYHYKFHGKEASMKDIKRIVVNSKVITLDGMKIISKKKLHKLAEEDKPRFYINDMVKFIDATGDEEVERVGEIIDEYPIYQGVRNYIVELDNGDQFELSEDELTLQNENKTASTKTSATKDIEVISTGTGVLQIFEKGDKYDYSGIETGEQIYEFSTEGMELIVDDIQNDKYYNIQFDTYDALTNFVNSIQHADTKQEISDLLKSNTASQKTATIKRNIMNKKALDSWVSEDNYMGEDYSDYYIVYTQTRDSEALERSNFKKALEMLGGESDDVLVARSGHWAVGWVETLLVKKDNAEKVKIAEEIEKQIGEYPVLDESDYYDTKSEEGQEYVDSLDDDEIKEIYEEIAPQLSASSLTLGDKAPEESEIIGWIKANLYMAVMEEEGYSGEIYVGDVAKKYLIETINEQIAEYNKQKESSKISGMYFGIKKQANKTKKIHKSASEEKPADEKALEEIANDKKADEESDNIDETTEKPADKTTENADADKNITDDAVIADQLDKVVAVNELIKSTEGGKFAVDFVLMVNGNFIVQNKEFNTKEEAEDYKNKLVKKAKAKVKDNSVKEEEQAVVSKEDIEKEKAEIQSQRKEIMAEKLRLELIKKSELAKKLAREAYEKGAISYSDSDFEEAVNVKMIHPIEACKQLEENTIKIHAKKIMAMTDEQIKGFEMVVNSFKKTASVEKKDLTLKTAFLNGDKGTKIFDDFEKELSRDTQSVEDAWAGILERAKSKK